MLRPSIIKFGSTSTSNLSSCFRLTSCTSNFSTSPIASAQPNKPRNRPSQSQSDSNNRFGDSRSSPFIHNRGNGGGGGGGGSGGGNRSGEGSSNYRNGNGNGYGNNRDGNNQMRRPNSVGQNQRFGDRREGASATGAREGRSFERRDGPSRPTAFSDRNSSNRPRNDSGRFNDRSKDQDSQPRERKQGEEVARPQRTSEDRSVRMGMGESIEEFKEKRRRSNPTSSTGNRDKERPNRVRFEEVEKREGHRIGGLGSNLVNKKKVVKKELKVKKEPVKKKEVFLPNFITTNNLARLLGLKMRTLQAKMTSIGLTDTRPDLLLSFSDSELLASEYDLTAIIDEEASFDIYPRPQPSEVNSLPFRPPVVTIMGHVDHGKTTLLDKLRSSSVALGEAGGITQHIGAFSVEVGKGADGTSTNTNEVKTITFLDTPGHAAFSAMRSRGANVTDIVVLVCAADDGVMPQTKEVIQLVKELNEESETLISTEGGKKKSGVQLVVALSKIDKSDSEPERVKRELLAAGVELEEFGGEIPCVEVSGKTGKGLVELEETLAALSELAELRAERIGNVEGFVLESRVEKGRGNIATVLVKRGCLKIGDSILSGTSWCKVRSIIDINNKNLKEAYPTDPVLITGWKDLPNAGDELLGANNELEAKKAVENRKNTEERKKLLKDVEIINESRRLKSEEDEAKNTAEFQLRERKRALRQASNAGTIALDPVTGAPLLSDEEIELESKRKEESDGEADVLEYRLIVKADFSGTVEAVIGAIEGIGNSEAKVKIVSHGVGDVTEGDVAMAQAVGGHILGFNVKAARSIQQQASRLQPQVEIHCDDVIYRLMSYTTDRVASLLPPRIEKRVLGEATIAQVFPINIKSRLFKNIAGCKVINGTVSRNSLVRVLRAGETLDQGDEEAGGRKVIFEGKLDTLKHLKKDVLEIRKGTDCGIGFEGFQDFKVDDVVQSFNKVEVPRTL